MFSSVLYSSGTRKDLQQKLFNVNHTNPVVSRTLGQRGLLIFCFSNFSPSLWTAYLSAFKVLITN